MAKIPELNLPTSFQRFTVQANGGIFLRPFQVDRESQIRTIGISNTNADQMSVRMSDDTAATSTLILGQGTFTFPRCNSGQLEIRSYTTNTATISIWAGNTEDSA